MYVLQCERLKVIWLVSKQISYYCLMAGRWVDWFIDIWFGFLEECCKRQHIKRSWTKGNLWGKKPYADNVSLVLLKAKSLISATNKLLKILVMILNLGHIWSLFPWLAYIFFLLELIIIYSFIWWLLLLTLYFSWWFSETVLPAFILQITGTLCILFTLSTELAPVLGLLMVSVSVLVGNFLNWTHHSGIVHHLSRQDSQSVIFSIFSLCWDERNFNLCVEFLCHETCKYL